MKVYYLYLNYLYRYEKDNNKELRNNIINTVIQVIITNNNNKLNLLKDDLFL